MARHNDYSRELGRIFGECPKTVLAAIAVSALTSGGDNLPLAAFEVAYEWKVLYEQGIVPQAPGKYARSAVLPKEA